ncbi:hypothetical protein FGO68_gene17534 [Halteria grandinella]|uniref:Uncharacterized protein n=1 Tax=Halteria grandinella TaxID=5974 RepID=A0A8J8NA58_HALGN|nr:hypothetical protein FGO68_gene17534 [Halteria grandinella]
MGDWWSWVCQGKCFTSDLCSSDLEGLWCVHLSQPVKKLQQTQLRRAQALIFTRQFKQQVIYIIIQR